MLPSGVHKHHRRNAKTQPWISTAALLTEMTKMVMMMKKVMRTTEARGKVVTTTT